MVSGKGSGLCPHSPPRVVRPVVRPAADRDPRPGARAEDHREDDVVPGAGAVDRLGDREAVGVVLDPDLAAERRAQVGLDRLAQHPGRAAALAEPAHRLERARHADPDRCRSAPVLGLELVDELADRRDAGGIVLARRVAAQAQQLAPVRLHRDALDLGAAPVDSDQHVQLLGPPPSRTQPK